MIINKRIGTQTSLKALVSVIESVNSAGKEYHISVLEWMLNCSIGGTYTSLSGNRIRCISKYNLTAEKYRQSVKRLIATKILKELGKGSNKTNPSYQIHPDIVLLHNHRNATIHITLEQ